jgi:hypothetical protein
MNDLRKAAEQALEALESLDCGDTYKTHNAASALRKALAHPEHEWIDLTDEDIQEIFDKWDGGNLWDGWNYEYAIAAKVKEKNT